MTEKRFTVHIKWFNYEKSEGEIELMDNGQPLLLSECVEDVQGVKRLLNELNDENEQLKQQNKGIQDKVWKLLELLEKEKGIDKRKIIDWWNGDLE